MNKLKKGTLENIKYVEVKDLLKENKEVSGVKEFIRSYLIDILEWENKEKINKQDFEIIGEEIAKYKEYQTLLKVKFKKDFSLDFVKIISFGQSLEEFKDFIENNKIIYLLEGLKEENLKIIFGLKGIFKIEDFIENKKIAFLVIHGKIENINIFFGEKGVIKTKEDLEEFIQNLNWGIIEDLIVWGETENIRIFFGEDGLIKTKEDFKEIIKNKNFGEIQKYINTWPLKDLKIFFGADSMVFSRKFLEGLINYFD